MKLELKHLAAYLPYELQLMFEKSGRIITMQSCFNEGTLHIYDSNEGNTYSLSIWNFKPLLYPLSSLTEYREDLGFVPIEELRKMYSGFYFESNPELLIKSKNTSMYISLNWTNEFKSILEKWHFDIFNLIENNLAIDKTTIK